MKPSKPIESVILDLRSQKVILDADLAALYEVPTKRLNEQVKRNADRFPEDFMFQLTAQEWNGLKSQNATSSEGVFKAEEDQTTSRSQIATTSHGGRRKLPYAFTEHGALQAANVLKSDRAAAMSVFVMRAFVQMRESLAANAAILQQFAAMDQKLQEHDEALVILWNKLKPLLMPPPPVPKRRIGFKP